MRFFGRVHSVLRVGGSFVLEPQEWESYHKARRMNPVRFVSLDVAACANTFVFSETEEP